VNEGDERDEGPGSRNERGDRGGGSEKNQVRRVLAKWSAVMERAVGNRKEGKKARSEW
jgi:hypothetical protein